MTKKSIRDDEPGGPDDLFNPPPPVSAAAEPDLKKPDPFDLDAIRESQDFGAHLGVRRTLKCIVQKPKNEWWIQVHPDDEFSIISRVVDLKDEREMYWVARDLWDDLAGEPTFQRKAFFTYTCKHTYRRGDCFLWPVKPPDESGKVDSWNESAMDYARQRGIWQRISSNTDMGCYDQYLTSAPWEVPTWPEVTFDQLVRAAFKGRVIETLDHPVIRNLRGE
jgi:hypothetical protein